MLPSKVNNFKNSFACPFLCCKREGVPVGVFTTRRSVSRQADFRTRRRVPSIVAMGFLQDLFGGGSSKAGATTFRRGCELAPSKAPEGLELATFAGGCFWGLELAYQRVPGVLQTSVGYTLGRDPSPTYESVCSGQTGHTEAVQVIYNPKEVDYEKLLDTFFEHVDPTTLNRQGGDRGTQYRSAICYHNEAQKAAALEAMERVDAKLASNVFRKVLGSKVVTELQPAGDYYVAEKYHQQYLSKGGRFGMAQSAEKGATDRIRCYG